MLRKVYRILIGPYTVFLLYLMLFGFGRFQYDENIVRMNPVVSTVDFAKSSFLWNRHEHFYINVFGNILMFVPFGFLGWLHPKYRKFPTLIFSFLSVLIIVEAVQYFSRMGIFDVDDFLLNTLGVALGFYVFRKLNYEREAS